MRTVAIHRAGQRPAHGREALERLKVRSAILGHASTSSLSMTEDRYTHLMPGDVEAAKTALARYLRGAENDNSNDIPDTRSDTRAA